MESILTKAIYSVQQSEISYCKFLSPNDTKSTKAHQAGYLVSKSSWALFLDKEPLTRENIKSNIIIKWQDDFETSSVFTYYGKKKNEFRLTRFGRNFPFREESNNGDLFILSKIKSNYYQAFILSHDDDIETFFSAFNISADQTNKIIPKQFEISTEDNLLNCFLLFVKSLKVEFPSTIELANRSRNCYSTSYAITKQFVKKNPDTELLNWLDAEFKLFKIIENIRYNKLIQNPFKSVEELVVLSNTILNRRKNRAGKSLEHHLTEMFNTFDLTFATQVKTEANKKPDFLFPSKEAYHSTRFDPRKLIMLASKTTCKDRWRQILNEADRIKTKHLFTLQQGISQNQLKEMYTHNVCLVVPEPYLKSFPKEYRAKILTLEKFVNNISSLNY